MARTLADVSAAARRRWIGVSLVAALVALVGATSLASAYHAVEHDATTASHVRWTENAQYTYGVPVAHNSTLWPEGTQLPMGMPAYYRTYSPNVTIHFTWNATTPDGAATPTLGDVNATATLRVRETTPEGREYWEFSRELATARATNASSLTLDTVLDVDKVIADTNVVTHELPADGATLNWTVETNVTYAMAAGGAGGDADQGLVTFDLPFDVHDPRYTLPLPEQLVWSTPHATIEARTVIHEAGFDGALADIAGLAMLAVGLAVLGFTLHARFVDPVARMPPRDEAYVREHLRHRSWITTTAGELDVGGFPASVVDVPTLEALVETAADARARVLHDASLRVYYVVLPTTTYRYARHAVSG